MRPGHAEAPEDQESDITQRPQGGKISQSALIFRRWFIYSRQTGVETTELEESVVLET